MIECRGVAQAHLGAAAACSVAGGREGICRAPAGGGLPCSSLWCLCDFANNIQCRLLSPVQVSRCSYVPGLFAWCSKPEVWKILQERTAEGPLICINPRLCVGQDSTLSPMPETLHKSMCSLGRCADPTFANCSQACTHSWIGNGG